MGKRKSYKTKSEFKDEREMRRYLSRYHDEVIHDLLAGTKKPSELWVREYDFPAIQQSHLRLGQGTYILTTSFSKTTGSVKHELDKIGATNHLVRTRGFV
jgi:hypothetical protein